MKKMIMLTIVAAMIAFSSVSVTKAADTKAPKAKTITVKGTVAVTKNAEGIITAVYLHGTMKGTLNITLDTKGKELGEKMNGKTVEVTGTETVKNSETWLTVEKYAEAKKIEKKPKY